MSLNSVLAVAIGSALGGVARFLLSANSVRWFGAGFPYATLAINVVGSLLIGLLFAATGPGGRWEAPMTARQFLMSGICGGFTTFSAFSLETLQLARDGAIVRAGAYVLLSVGLCLTAVWLGHTLGAVPLSRR